MGVALSGWHLRIIGGHGFAMPIYRNVKWLYIPMDCMNGHMPRLGRLVIRPGKEGSQVRGACSGQVIRHGRHGFNCNLKQIIINKSFVLNLQNIFHAAPCRPAKTMPACSGPANAPCYKLFMCSNIYHTG